MPQSICSRLTEAGFSVKCEAAAAANTVVLLARSSAMVR
eukprot:COSAG01_NODE_7905_length_2998_cov_8.705761_1_plen_39_part_00